MKRSGIKYLTLLLSIFLFSDIVNAQKLPNKQEASLRSPGNIKIDGHAAEWAGQFAAYNKRTQLFYTVSNNDDHIYLIVQATDSATVQQIIAHGLTFAVKSGKRQLGITFPLFKNTGDYRDIRMNLAYNPAIFLTDPVAIKRVTDSMVYVMNNQIITRSNEFSVSGISSRGDTIVPIDNQTDIKAIGLFENKGTYTLEFAISFKYLPANTDKLSYYIKINGTPAKDSPQRVIRSGIAVLSEQDLMKIRNAPRPDLPVVDQPIDFWGEYTLAKRISK